MHTLFIYYIDHRLLTLPPPDSPEGSALYTGTEGTMRRAGQKLAPKYVIRKLAKQILCRNILQVEGTSLLTGPHGKPYLPQEESDASPVCINLSHGRDYSVLAVSDRELGVDIQEIPKEISPEVEAKGCRKRDLTAERTFPAVFLDRYAQLKQQNAPVRIQREVFTELWTQTEAVLKAEGSGFSLDLRNHPELLDKWILQSIRLDDHVITAAMEEPFVIELISCSPHTAGSIDR